LRLTKRIAPKGIAIRGVELKLRRSEEKLSLEARLAT
jgi:hypothetical protein